jgi:hypothetical protein
MTHRSQHQQTLIREPVTHLLAGVMALQYLQQVPDTLQLA